MIDVYVYKLITQATFSLKNCCIMKNMVYGYMNLKHKTNWIHITSHRRSKHTLVSEPLHRNSGTEWLKGFPDLLNCDSQDIERCGVRYPNTTIVSKSITRNHCNLNTGPQKRMMREHYNKCIMLSLHLNVEIVVT